MKTAIYYIMLFCLFGLMSCKDEPKVQNYNFYITVDKNDSIKSELFDKYELERDSIAQYIINEIRGAY